MKIGRVKLFYAKMLEAQLFLHVTAIHSANQTFVLKNVSHIDEDSKALTSFDYYKKPILLEI